MSGVIASHTSGDVFIVRKNVKKKISAIYPYEPVKLKDGDRVITGSNGYIVSITDEGGKYATWMDICPNTEMVLRLKNNKMIVGIDIKKGTCYLRTSCPITVPLAEIVYPLGASNFMVRVEPRAVFVAADATPLIIRHKASGKEVQIFPNQQVVVTKRGISGPHSVDEDFKREYRAIQAVRAGYLDRVTKEQIIELYRNIPKQIEGIIEALESQLWIIGKDGFLRILDSLERSIIEAPRFVREALGDEFIRDITKRLKKAKKKVLEYDDSKLSIKRDIDELEKVVKEAEQTLPPRIVALLKLTLMRFKGLVEETMEETKKREKKGVAIARPKMETKELNVREKYRNIQVVVYSMSIGSSYKGRSLKGKKFLVLDLGLKNISKKTQFLFPFEEIRLEIGSGNIINIDNDYIEHELPPGKEVRGEVVFIVPSEGYKYSLIIGKKRVKKIKLT